MLKQSENLQFIHQQPGKKYFTAHKTIANK